LLAESTAGWGRWSWAVPPVRARRIELDTECKCEESLRMDPQNVNILVVDDDSRICGYMAKFLTDRGWTADTASDGASAMELAQHKTYDAVVLDYRMPGMDGAELCRRIREIQPEIRSVFVTGFPTIDTVFPAVDAGAQRVLAKPVDPDALIRVLEQQLSEAAGPRISGKV
jgi:two-component system, response regulator, stage 0 sporulation protein F